MERFPLWLHSVNSQNIKEWDWFNDINTRLEAGTSANEAGTIFVRGVDYDRVK